MLQKIIILAMCGLLVQAQNISKVDDETSYILPTFVKPKSYKLTITPHPDKDIEKNFTFDGSVEITFEVEESVPRVIIHSKNLEFNSTDCDLIKSSGESIIISEIEFDDRTEFAYISKADGGTFTVGTYVLTIDYTGKIANNLRGFFKYVYENSENVKVWLALTHLFPNYARSVFPCFDEPNYKATFNITIIHDEEYNVFSNMKIRNTFFEDLKIATNFEITPPMSTYLVAFVITPKLKTMSNTHNNITVIDPQSLEKSHFIMNRSELILKEMEDFTGIKYDIGKLDHFGSRYLISLAMENWGLIIYKYSELYPNLNYRVQQMITYGIIHNWFGNLVSIKWWDDQWLSEGITEYLLYYIINKIDSSSFFYNFFVGVTVSTVMNEDSRSDSPAVHLNVVTPESIRSRLKNILQSNIISGKGAALTRMLQHIVSEEIFQNSMRKYLIKFKFGNANSDDLYEAFQEVLDSNNMGISVKAIMDTWINFPGYPVVDVIRSYDSKKMKISQQRFMQDECFNDSNHTYAIPVNFATAAEPDFEETSPKYWLTNSSIIIDVDVKPEDWIILNKQQTGYYRVNYDTDNWKLIINYLNSPNYINIHVFSRIQLISDAFAFFKQEKLDTELFLSLIYYLRHETDPGVWALGFQVIDWLNNKFINSKHNLMFRNFMQLILNPLFNSTRFEETNLDDSIHFFVPYNVRIWSCYLGVTSCLNESQNILTSFFQTGLGSSDSLCNGMKTANYSVWNKFYIITNRQKDNSTKNTLKEILLCTNDKKSMEKYIHEYVNLNSGDLTELFALINKTSLPTNRNLDVFIDFLIGKVFNSSIKCDVMSEILDKIGNVITSDQLLKLKNSKYPDALNETINTIESKVSKDVAWINKHENALKNILKNII